MVSFELQRKNMVESQVRPSDITDRRIIRAMLAIPREAFAAAETRATAYMDQDLAVTAPVRGARRYLVAPRLYAKLAQHLEMGEADSVLEIGAATGYGAAVLSRVARAVVALDSDPEFSRSAAAALAVLPGGAPANVTVVTGPLAAGWSAEGPYDAILIAGSITDVPAGLLDQLKDGGRLAAVVADGGIGRLIQWRRLGAAFDVRTIGEASAPRLPGFDRAPAFVF